MIAIYTQTHKSSGVVRYEVIRIQEHGEITWPTGKITPAGESYPGSKSWGQDGWTFFRLQDAQKHLKRLHERSNASEA